jgi:hypothetical protein
MSDEKAPSAGIFSPASLMYFCCGEPMHFCSGVDTPRINEPGNQASTKAVSPNAAPPR